MLLTFYLYINPPTSPSHSTNKSFQNTLAYSLKPSNKTSPSYSHIIMDPPVVINIANINNPGFVKLKTFPSCAYVTFLAGNGDYWKGVVALAKGLRKAKSLYPLVVAMLPDVPMDHRQKLLFQGCIIREIEPLYPPGNQTQFAMAYYVINYSKLRIWEVTTLSFYIEVT